jgi:hypothetical protein
MSIAWTHVRCMYKLIHTKEKIWMDGDGYRGKDTCPHTFVAVFIVQCTL